MKSLSEYLPTVYLESDADGSLAAFITAFDTVHNQLLGSMESLATVNQPRSAPLAFLPYVANHYGNPFPFMTPERWQEGAKAENLEYLYSIRGTEKGLQSAIHYLCGVTVTVLQDFEYCWSLGESQLGSVSAANTGGFGSGFGSAFGS